MRKSADSETAKRKALLKEEKYFQQQMRRATDPAERLREKGKRRTAQEERAHLENEVAQNLTPELAAVRDMVKKQFKPKKRETLTEQFLRYVEENPDDVVSIQQEMSGGDEFTPSAADLAEMEALEMKLAQKSRGRAGRSPRGRGTWRAEGGGSRSAWGGKANGLGVRDG